MAERVILVDENDRQLGTEEKMAAHEKGLLHRAFSLYVFNKKGQLLLQQRALSKYHCGGMWTNTCCSHPRVGESDSAAAHRRLQEEMGFDCALTEAFSMIYKTPVSDRLTEHEFLHVFIGRYDKEPIINKDEVESHAWVDVATLRNDMRKHPEKYTPWFRICIDKVLENVKP